MMQGTAKLVSIITSDLQAWSMAKKPELLKKKELHSPMSPNIKLGHDGSCCTGLNAYLLWGRLKKLGTLSEEK